MERVLRGLPFPTAPASARRSYRDVYIIDSVKMPGMAARVAGTKLPRPSSPHLPVPKQLGLNQGQCCPGKLDD